MTTTTSTPPSTPRLLSPDYRALTIGAVSLASMIAFEYLAVATAMPTVARELHGLPLYALAFGASLAAGVVGLVVGGIWSDSNGPRGSVWQGVTWFVVGLAIAGLAPSMWALVAGRIVQGFGGGLLSVALYVVVGHCYPARLHPKMFGAFAAAWVLPSIIGPALTGFVVTQWSWRWIFLAIALLALPAALLVRPALTNLASSPRAEAANSKRRILWALGAALGAVRASLRWPAARAACAGSPRSRPRRRDALCSASLAGRDRAHETWTPLRRGAAWDRICRVLGGRDLRSSDADPPTWALAGGSGPHTHARCRLVVGGILVPGTRGPAALASASSKARHDLGCGGNRHDQSGAEPIDSDCRCIGGVGDGGGRHGTHLSDAVGSDARAFGPGAAGGEQFILATVRLALRCGGDLSRRLIVRCAGGKLFCGRLRAVVRDRQRVRPRRCAVFEPGPPFRQAAGSRPVTRQPIVCYALPGMEI